MIFNQAENEYLVKPHGSGKCFGKISRSSDHEKWQYTESEFCLSEGVFNIFLGIYPVDFFVSVIRNPETHGEAALELWKCSKTCEMLFSEDFFGLKALKVDSATLSSDYEEKLINLASYQKVETEDGKFDMLSVRFLDLDGNVLKKYYELEKYGYGTLQDPGFSNFGLLRVFTNLESCQSTAEMQLCTPKQRLSNWECVRCQDFAGQSEFTLDMQSHTCLSCNDYKADLEKEINNPHSEFPEAKYIYEQVCQFKLPSS